jgi:hypothetical protein
MLPMKAPVFVIAFMIAVAPTMAAEKPVHMPGIYSDLRYDKATDDISGTEIFIVPAAGGYTAFVQFAEGEPGVALAVPVNVSRDRISFTVPEPSGGAGVYDGRISATEFVGTVTTTNNGKTNSTPIRLARKKSYWQ